MSYFRRSLGDGDGPITSPSQVDDSIIVGEVTPNRVPCSALPADSPWRRPGQVCAPTIFESLREWFGLDPESPTSGTTSPAPTQAASSDGPSLALLAGVGALAWYLMRKKR